MRIGVLLLFLMACGGAETSPGTSAAEATAVSETTAADDGCAHVIDAEVEADDDGTYTVSVTVSSADTGEDFCGDVFEVAVP